MLKEFINQQKETPPSKNLDQKKFVDTTTQTFDNLVDFLRDPQKFPNSKINDSATLMWRLISNKEILTTLDLDNNMPAASFIVLEQNHRKFPLIILPKDFIDSVRKQPEAQLGIIAYLSSQCRDFYAGKITGTNSKQVNKRAQGYESEALLTLQQMASQENLSLNFIPFQRTVLEELPEGLKSLPSKLDYATPPYPRNKDTGYRYN